MLNIFGKLVFTIPSWTVQIWIARIVGKKFQFNPDRVGWFIGDHVAILDRPRQ